MPSRRQAQDQAINEFFNELGGAEAELLLDCVIAGCAIVAYADGRVTQEERKRMMGQIRRFEPLRGFGNGDLADSFERATVAFADDHDEGERRALALVGQLRDRRRMASMLLRTCHAIASTDGVIDPEEHQAMIRICWALGLDPANHELGVARRIA